ncbi:RpiB/LacA/LacB family sugar-phosphate isomerase [Patescibacteria group bacterium]|nr:RpiB/LacA/LacB family sugar-phosphate isomerase [Patescibacteria group bacterium]
MLYIGADHRGFDLKDRIKQFLSAQHIAFTDVGAATHNPDDDYTDYAAEVGRAIAANDHDSGVLICANGEGMCMTANKFKHVRGAVAVNEWMAVTSKEDDHTNVLCLPAEMLSADAAERIIAAWLAAQPKTEEKYMRRLEKLRRIEE